MFRKDLKSTKRQRFRNVLAYCLTHTIIVIRIIWDVQLDLPCYSLISKRLIYDVVGRSRSLGFALSELDFIIANYGGYNIFLSLVSSCATWGETEIPG